MFAPVNRLVQTDRPHFENWNGAPHWSSISVARRNLAFYYVVFARKKKDSGLITDRRSVREQSLIRYNNQETGTLGIRRVLRSPFQDIVILVSPIDWHRAALKMSTLEV